MVVSGCGAKSYQKQRYLLETRRASSVAASSNEDILEIRRFTIDPAFSSKGLTYRNGEYEYESDFYNEFLISPDVMVTEKVRNWLSASGLTQRVLNPGSFMDPSYVLEGNIDALYGDFRMESSGKAVMELRVFLLEMKTGTEPAMVFGKNYKTIFDIESESAEELVAALDRCLVEILTDLEKDLRARLN
jgi:ABC-type uncharacterized transport system auxiliary subunit